MADKNLYKVAVASTDGKNIDVHYGKADKFFIYQIDDEAGFDFIEVRNTKPACFGSGHLVAEMERSTSQFTDCRYVVAARIGSGAAASLAAKGISGMELPETIDDALIKVQKYNQIQGLFG